MLLDKVKDKAIGLVMADYWKSYNEVVSDNILIQNKKEKFRVKSYNGLIIYFIARFRRKTKFYTKRIEMRVYTLIFFLQKGAINYLYLITNSENLTYEF